MNTEPEAKGITVFCASSPSIAAEYFAAARAVGHAVAKAGVPLITGAGNMGLMGATNNAAIEAGGETIGVIPQFMVERGWHHTGLSQLLVTDSMHSRKSAMARMAAGVIALPGGIGTLEELCEIITWRQLGLYKGEIVLLNIRGYYDNFDAMIRHAMSEGFMPCDHRRLFTITSDPELAVATALGKDRETDIAFSPKF